MSDKKMDVCVLVTPDGTFGVAPLGDKADQVRLVNAWKASLTDDQKERYATLHPGLTLVHIQMYESDYRGIECSNAHWLAAPASLGEQRDE